MAEEFDWESALLGVVYAGVISRSQYLRVDNNDAEPMTKDEIIRRRFEGKMMHKYGDHLLSLSFFGGFPAVVIGDPKQEIILSVVE